MIDDSKEVPDEDDKQKFPVLNTNSTKVDEASNSSSTSITHDQSINRKWVKQMKKRIREFVSNSSHVGNPTELNPFSELNSDLSKSGRLSGALGTDVKKNSQNFGIQLDKCEPSSISPVSKIMNTSKYYLNLTAQFGSLVHSSGY